MIKLSSFLYPSLPLRAALKGKPKSFTGDDWDRDGSVTFSLLKQGGLSPRQDVLDIGCGNGRMAKPILEHGCSYKGFDIVKSAMDRANKEFGPYFSHIDTYNMLYNPFGKITGDVTFPYAPKSFSFIFAISVFTHLMPDQVRNYLSEIKRVGRPGFNSYLTFFLLNKNSLANLINGKTRQTFPHRFDGYRTYRLIGKCGAVAYDESLIKEMITDCGLKLQSIRYGCWSHDGPKENPDPYQDVIAVTQ